ncbi:MAG: orotate phosphoribosyltransferase [Thermovirgaceae bacterium]|nr:orotate phosphoribosyltransferase [Thermovirgaceae bacterium]
MKGTIEMEAKERMLKSGALLEGHFRLSSGMHSGFYLQCALFLRYPENAEWAGSLIAGMIAPFSPELVISPALGGLIIGHEVARHLKIPFIFCERENGIMKLRRFPAPGRLSYVIVEDVVTTGRSTLEVADAIKALSGGEFLAGACILDRSTGMHGIRPELFSLMKTDFPVYPEAGCPLCQKGIPMIEPGSRRLSV